MLVRQAPDYLEFLVRRETRTRDLDRLEEKVAAVNAVLPHIAKLSSAVERAGWAGRLADALGIDDEVVLQELRTVARAGRGGARPDAGGGAARGPAERSAAGSRPATVGGRAGPTRRRAGPARDRGLGRRPDRRRPCCV